MRAGGPGLLPLVLVCGLAASVGEAQVFRRSRTSWTRPYQTQNLATTTTNKATPVSYNNNNNNNNNNNHHRLNHHHNNKHHRLFSNNNNNNQRNSTRGHKKSTRNYHNQDANRFPRHHSQPQKQNHLGSNENNGRRYHHHRYFSYNPNPNHNNNRDGSRERKHHNHNHHAAIQHFANLFANHNHHKQSIKRHLGGMRRHLQHQTPFTQPIRMHAAFRSSPTDSLLSYQRSPQPWDLSSLRNRHDRIMHHLSSRLRDHVMMRPHSSVPHVSSSYHRLHSGHPRPSHPQSGSRSQDSVPRGRRVHCHHNQPRQDDSSLEDRTRPRTQFKDPKEGIGGIPEDVEVFRWPATFPGHHRPTTTTTTTTTTSTPRPTSIDDIFRRVDNCTTSGSWRPHSSSHPHPAGASRGKPNYQPPPKPSPDTAHQNPILTALFPGLTPSAPPRWEGRGATDSHTPTSVQDHLNPQGNSRPSLSRPAALPCIKCPPDTRVLAPRGKDCVYAHTPSPLSCTPQWRPDVQTMTEVTEGPTPGTRLQEGHYAISFRVLVVGDGRGSPPLATCRVAYDVEVRKCPELPRGAGLEARCSAGRAWGSRCTWRCTGTLQLRGAASTTCSGHHRPRWTHEPPSCVAPPSPAPLPPPPASMCQAPPDVPGGHYICTPPTGRPVNIPIPKDDPAVLRTSRDTTPTHHIKGTVCELECGRGRTIAVSQRGRRRLTCAPGGRWDQRPPPCRLQVSPVLKDGDCKDTTLKPPHSLLSFLPLPNFQTSSGVAARVTCVLEARSEGIHTRACSAKDPELETTTHCKYRITQLDATPDPDAVLVPGLTGRGAGRGAGREAGRGAGHGAGPDEWEAEGQHPDNGNGDSTEDAPDIYAYSSSEKGEEEDDDYEFDYDDDEEEEDEFDYYYDGSDFDDEDFIDDYDGEIETIPELQRVQGQTLGAGTKRRGGRVNSHGGKKKHKGATRNSTTTKQAASPRRQHSGKTMRISSVSSTSSTSASSSFPSLSPNHRSEDALTPSKHTGATVPEAERETWRVGKKSLDSRSHDVNSRRHTKEESRKHHHQHKHLRGEPINKVETNANGKLTQREDRMTNAELTSPSPRSDRRTGGDGTAETRPRRPAGEASVPATMEAVVKMEVLVVNCSVSRDVARLLGKALKNQAGCVTALTCHNPRHTCKEASRAGGRARVELLWAVGGLYENQEGDDTRPRHHAHHVPEVETAIAAILESTRGILTSQSLASSLAGLGAAADADSFLVTRLDLVCRQPGLLLRPGTSRCWPE